jgi:putative nucleotidyltransferase with HDIG domain
MFIRAGYKEQNMNHELETLIMTASDLPTIPVVATKVMRLIETEGVSAEELARVVSADPAVAARVLKISNSSYYGCQRQIQTLSHAIMMLGYNTLRSLVVAASVKQVYKPYGLTEKMLWEHSFGAGLAARLIANQTRLGNEEEAFLGGLFHDIGKIIMNFFDNQQFQKVMEKCYNEQISFLEAEQQVYSYTHAEVGGLVIKKWNFPEMLMKAVLQHHHFHFEHDEDPCQVKLTCVVGLANLFCHKLGIGVREPEEGLLLHETIPAKALNLDEASLSRLVEDFDRAYTQDKSFFN